MVLPFYVMTKGHGEKRCSVTWGESELNSGHRVLGCQEKIVFTCRDLGGESETTSVKHIPDAGHVAGTPQCYLPFLSLRCGSTSQ